MGTPIGSGCLPAVALAKAGDPEPIIRVPSVLIRGLKRSLEKDIFSHSGLNA
jgi:hypothetical protein